MEKPKENRRKTETSHKRSLPLFHRKLQVKKEAEGFRVTSCSLSSIDVDPTSDSDCKQNDVEVVQDIQSARSSAALPDNFLQVSDFAIKRLTPLKDPQPHKNGNRWAPPANRFRSEMIIISTSPDCLIYLKHFTCLAIIVESKFSSSTSVALPSSQSNFRSRSCQSTLSDPPLF
ncbi:hypothetical protein DAPPUDRAFT_95250 [Daphnia pulex]|uniref:Uncharacterized protein n=1 Tax=Daphnia pulex TaxID=6669 RepID=E9FV42_DAPPU|nr:hypothetical protein DAPPUDRAFT_95250 [Daphnia pulex]|eukprot:EFX88492.1 hypothetical protein DAPPUDRAFT_95250 [Daphnia pulex]